MRTIRIKIIDEASWKRKVFLSNVGKEGESTDFTEPVHALRKEFGIDGHKTWPQFRGLTALEPGGAQGELKQARVNRKNACQRQTAGDSGRRRAADNAAAKADITLIKHGGLSGRHCPLRRRKRQ